MAPARPMATVLLAILVFSLCLGLPAAARSLRVCLVVMATTAAPRASTVVQMGNPASRCQITPWVLSSVLGASLNVLTLPPAALWLMVRGDVVPCPRPLAVKTECIAVPMGPPVTWFTHDAFHPRAPTPY